MPPPAPPSRSWTLIPSLSNSPASFSVSTCCGSSWLAWSAFASSPRDFRKSMIWLLSICMRSPIVADGARAYPVRADLSVRVALTGRDRCVQSLLRAVEPALANLGELLAALPQGERVLESGSAGLQPPDDVDQLLPGFLVAEVLVARLDLIGLVPLGHWFSPSSLPELSGPMCALALAAPDKSVSVLFTTTWMRPSLTRTCRSCSGVTWPVLVTTCPSLSWSTA